MSYLNKKEAYREKCERPVWREAAALNGLARKRWFPGAMDFIACGQHPGDHDQRAGWRREASIGCFPRAASLNHHPCVKLVAGRVTENRCRRSRPRHHHLTVVSFPLCFVPSSPPHRIRPSTMLQAHRVYGDTSHGCMLSSI